MKISTFYTFKKNSFRGNYSRKYGMWCNKWLLEMDDLDVIISHHDNQLHKDLPLHTVSSQDFRSLPFSVIFLSKIVHPEFICEITMFSSKLLSFDKFFLIVNLLATFKPSFLIKARQILERSQQIQIL